MNEHSGDNRNEFAARMTEILNHGALNAAMAIGSRLGLFDVMDEMTTPETVPAIAEAAGLSPRYTAEWLGVMVCGGVVDITVDETGTERYRLPQAQADLLTRRAGRSNLGIYTQEIPLLTGCAMESVIRGFQTGEGVSPETYPAFRRFMGKLADVQHRETLLPRFLPSVDDGRLVEAMRRGISVLDIGCGEGVAARLMAEAFPRSRFVGVDIDPAAVSTAEKNAREVGLTNLRFQATDAALLPEMSAFQEAFDYVTAFDAIHDQRRPQAAAAGVFYALRPGGLFSMVDIKAETGVFGNRDHPMGPFLYTVSLMHCMPVGLADGGAGLGMMWGRTRALSLLKDAGFSQAETCDIPQDPFNIHYLCRKSR